ncbi:CMP/dCMP deaminase [Methanobrevibacter ruminantium M1]|uniref:CMP/dCMP deaminase n=1 Tax=Methanobrevibacter ruminantium (strain ATCC 35063 / DSM 1093 / JCM 13430 / OCM 146 / M1) TaxID=634498 RepID=D3E3M5_METRM|nr:dCMP deaminase family protein [Methanobrevibacter ruminantium]ADC47136.1 CMP/dCMP deaminase [Methanobrevibacter ruminantium M1]
MVNDEKSLSRMSKTDYYLAIAFAVSKRSTCLKRHYGAVIVNNDEIISTGYNGNPRGEENCCDRGSCKRMDVPSNSGDYSDCFSVHAEQNAMISASRNEMIGATIYLAGEMFKDDSWFEIEDAEPCPICFRMIKNSGVKKIVSKGVVIDL